jgi:hypothetical protein
MARQISILVNVRSCIGPRNVDQSLDVLHSDVSAFAMENAGVKP